MVRRALSRTKDPSGVIAMSRKSGERAQAFPIIVVIFIVLLGFVGLTIDVGFALLQKRRLQAAVDMAALSGALELPGATAASTASQYAEDNFNLSSNIPLTQVNTSTSCMTAGCAAHDRLRVSARAISPTFFVKLFGIDSWNVGAAGAACGPCDSSVAYFDVMVVLDRSGSMSGQDMVNARAGIRELLSYFDPDRDRVGLTVLESADDREPRFHGAGTAPCESDGSSVFNINSTLYDSRYRVYGGSYGAFMDGTAANHDSWVLIPLSQGGNFKLANGSLNESSDFLNTLDCLKDGGSTPIGPAVYEATNEIENNGRADDEVTKVIVYMGDGGASTTPTRRDCRRRANNRATWSAWGPCLSSDAPAGENKQWRMTGAQGWYPWSSGNRDRPCADAIAQSQRAANYGIDVYTIGYGVEHDYCYVGITTSGNEESPRIRQNDTIRLMASDSDKYFEQVRGGDVTAIFAQIGRDITAGGTRLVE